MVVVMLDLISLQEAFATHLNPNPDYFPYVDYDRCNSNRTLCMFGTGPDSDSDYLSDDFEVNVVGTDPNNADTDGDNDPDGWEIAQGADPLANDGICTEQCIMGVGPDTDLDHATDDFESNVIHTDINDPDTDGDGVPDGRDPDPIDMFVVPESPIGSVAIVVSSMAALLGFIGIQAYRKRL